MQGLSSPGFSWCLVAGTPLAFLVLSPLTVSFTCLLGWLEPEAAVAQRIRVGWFLFLLRLIDAVPSQASCCTPSA